MRLTGLFAGREALITEGQAINTVADNISNLNTTGFKASRSEFANLLASSEGNLYGSPLDPGNGVRIENLRIGHDKQGTFDFTNRGTDMAVDGKGFFTVTDGTSQFYTRAGNFSVDKAGDLVTEEGLSVLGFTAASPAAAAPLTVNGVSGTAVPSAVGALAGNLNTGAPVVALPAATSFTTLNATADFVSPVTVVDSLGAAHGVSLYFYHTGPLQYTINAYVDGADSAGGVPGLPVAIGSSVVTVGSNGLQAEGTGTPLALNATWSNGSIASAVALDTTGLTGFASSTNLSKVTMDGNRAGSAVGYQVSKDGSFEVLLDTGDTVNVGTVVLSQFTNQDGLRKLGNNRFTSSDESGEPLVGAASVGGAGDIVGGALESSTVDPANEFIDMIRFQRAYQAGSQVVKTVSEMLDTALQLA